MFQKYLFSSLTLISVTFSLFGQEVQSNRDEITYEELYDEPYSINKLFIGFQPLYSEVFTTNVNAGFGIEAAYYYQDKADFRANFRKTYSSNFFDLNRDLASKNSSVSNKPSSFSYIELGGTYHWKDVESISNTKMVLHKKSYKKNKWAGSIPLTTEVPTKVRKIYGARLGAILWNSTVDIDRILKKQNLTHANLINSEGVALPDAEISNVGLTQDLRAFSNISSAGLYVGVSSSWFRNVVVSFDSYEDAVDDGMLTLFLDILYSPSLSVDDITYRGNDYSVDSIKTNPLGFRFGIDGKFNRTLSWSYGGELGYRPSLKGRGFFAMFKISFPIFGTNFDRKSESLVGDEN